MAKVMDIRQMAAYITGLKNTVERAAAEAMVWATTKAEGEAKKNAMRVFRGTRERPKSGQLVAAIFSGYEKTKDGVEGFVGVRSKKGRSGTRPYGRIHEYGGRIKPVRAKRLWLPLTGPKTSGLAGQFKNLTPRDLIQGMRRRGRKRADDEKFFVKTFGDGNGIAGVSRKRGNTVRTVLLFALRQQVEMPSRPYVRPAVEKVYGELPERIAQALKKGKR